MFGSFLTIPTLLCLPDRWCSSPCDGDRYLATRRYSREAASISGDSREREREYSSPFNALHVLPVCYNNCAYAPITVAARIGSTRHQRRPNKQDRRRGADCYLPLSGRGNKSSSDAEHALHSVPTTKQSCQIHPVSLAEHCCTVALCVQVLPVLCAVCSQ